jgi:hypothetical protein
MAATNGQGVVAGVFDARQQARDAIGALKDAGFESMKCPH